jgi:stalled ribosome rescue protein Dom34
MTVLLIDHHGARLFESAGSGTALEEREHLKPKDPHGFERHLEHRKEADYRGQRVPEADEFYERVAQRLRSASPIVLIGDGTGKSSAMEYLLEYLKEKHKEIADRVVAAERANLSGITLGQIEEIAARH